MPKAPAASTWAGAPPVTEDGFAFAEGVFFAQASGQNRHRRATATELKEHFTSGNDKDHPAHWFEAQLIHYGLQPSKTKSVARMRLFDAVNAGNLKVPDNVSKLETKLKKEWTKKDREAKKGATSGKPAAKAPVAKAEKKSTAGTKRKTNDDDNTAAVKKAKTTTPKVTVPKASGPKTATPKTKAPPKTPAKATAKTTTKATTKAPKKAATESTTPAKPLTKQTARCSRGGVSQGPGRNAAANASASEPARPPPQMARRGGAFAARGRIPVPLDDFGDAPPPYSEYPGQDDYSDGNSPNNSYRSYDSDQDEDDSLEPLGLLNGDYAIVRSDVTEKWDHYDLDDLNLTLTLAGNKLWGQFNLGVYEGVLRFDERPMRSSHDRLNFTWRGREDQGPVMYGNNNTGWMEFLGNGRINGWLDHQSLSFRARRIEGQGTRSRIDAASLQDEWSGYTYELYEEENRARW
ncbi:hypothetical protein FLAG1_06223 [Fusarium langsethiae]|uniref:Uncharacterized protein n=1 Tax=Fusarium langsethiae TaxID=179993 RepID=A0A0N0DEC3_FUSLA|nr:hypothetical protein FLAG1_06223 [Fusarium langsethiae]GKU03583.1 unnamed protein product [Fusarium langsethiae]GKU21457.1 unnamed protein product [Fusarium langsethiae]